MKLAEAGFERNIARIVEDEKRESTREKSRREQGGNNPQISDNTFLSAIQERWRAHARALLGCVEESKTD
jgi:hypothetical protein